MELEAKRKIAHILGGILLVILVNLKVFNGLSLFLVSSIIYAAFLLSLRSKNRFSRWVLSNLERPKADFPGKGAVFFIIGACIVLLFFPKDIACASIMILAIGDGLPTLISCYSKLLPNPLSDRKYIEGIVLGFIFSFIGALIFVRWQEALFACLIALTLEVIGIRIKGRKLDDNILVPVIAGAVMWFVRFL